MVELSSSIHESIPSHEILALIMSDGFPGVWCPNQMAWVKLKDGRSRKLQECIRCIMLAYGGEAYFCS